MSLDTLEHVRRTWGSHMPFLASVVLVQKPRSIIECGCGDFSTPIVQMAQKLITIEHDIRWAHRTAKNYKKHHSQHQWIEHEFTGITNATRRSEAKSRDLDAVDIFYHEILASLPKKVGFVFVDTFTAARVPAVNNLSKLTDMLMLHDLEGTSPQHYDYHLLKMKGWARYRFAPQGPKVNGQHEIPSTDLFTRAPIDTEPFMPILKRESEALWGPSVGVQIERIPND